MGFMSWSDNLSISVMEIDNQHKHLIDLINNLYDAMKMGKGKDVLSTTLDELATYSVEHFSAEERYMQKYSYDGYNAHKTEHDSFIRKVTEFKQGFEAGKALLSIEVMNFLRDWTVNHIAEVDTKFGMFLNTKGFK
ncbi:MAG: hemerythrin family protein [Brevinematales bacterium]|nr:hemerythrin family protein [Brevinematales bacterium]